MEPANKAIYRRSSSKKSGTNWEDEAEVLVAVTKDGMRLELACTGLRENKSVVLAAVQQNGLALKHAALEIKGDRDVAVAAVTQNWLAIQHVSKDLRADKVIGLLAIVNGDYKACQYISTKLLSDRDIIVAAIAKDGKGLQFARKPLNNDKELVKSAVLKNGMALQYASEELRNNDEIIRAAVSNDVKGRKFAAAEWRRNNTPDGTSMDGDDKSETSSKRSSKSKKVKVEFPQKGENSVDRNKKSDKKEQSPKKKDMNKTNKNDKQKSQKNDPRGQSHGTTMITTTSINTSPEKQVIDHRPNGVMFIERPIRKSSISRKEDEEKEEVTTTTAKVTTTTTTTTTKTVKRMNSNSGSTSSGSGLIDGPIDGPNKRASSRYSTLSTNSKRNSYLKVEPSSSAPSDQKTPPIKKKRGSVTKTISGFSKKMEKELVERSFKLAMHRFADIDPDLNEDALFVSAEATAQAGIQQDGSKPFTMITSVLGTVLGLEEEIHRPVSSSSSSSSVSSVSSKSKPTKSTIITNDIFKPNVHTLSPPPFNEIPNALKWKLSSGGYLINQESSLVLEVYLVGVNGKNDVNESTKRCNVRGNIKIPLSSGEDDRCQQWRVTETGQIQSVLTGSVLTVKKGSSKPFTAIWVREANFTKAQMWYIE